MDSGRLDINLLGTSFSIQANESDEYLKSIYSYFVDCVSQVESTVGQNLEPIKVAIVAGILLSDELKKERLFIQQLNADEQENYQIVARTKKLIEKLDNVENIFKDENLD
ncbi:MAG: cell division protein ZapA [Treponemataceae bacterium]